MKYSQECCNKCMNYIGHTRHGDIYISQDLLVSTLEQIRCLNDNFEKCIGCHLVRCFVYSVALSDLLNELKVSKLSNTSYHRLVRWGETMLAKERLKLNLHVLNK